MGLVWTGKPRWAMDGFDETGVRVAYVGRYSDPIAAADGLAFARYWMAFVRRPDFEIVLADGEPGRWRSGAEAKAAAEEAFAAWLTETGDGAAAALARAAATTPPKPVSAGKQVRMGTKAILTTVLAAWSPLRRRRAADRPPS